MTPETVLGLGQKGVLMVLYLAGPLLGAGLLVGLVVSVLQAITSVQEQSLTYIPKLLAVFGVLLLMMPWMMSLMVSFTAKLLAGLPMFAR